MNKAAPRELREVRGPSAFGGGWRRFLDLLWLMSVTEFKRSYFGTVLGYVWSLVRPLLLFLILLFVFTRVFRVGSQVPNYPVLLLLNIVVFTFFQEATQNAVGSVVAQEGIVRKTQFPRLVIPLSIVLTATFNFFLNLIVVFIFILAWGVNPTWTWFLFPLALLVLLLLTTGVSMVLSALYVRFRDVMIIWTVFTSVLFYGTPILYPLNPEVVPHEGGWLGLLPATAIFVAVCVLGIWIFSRAAPRVAEEL
jgi:ABC-2 type transport system permease protein